MILGGWRNTLFGAALTILHFEIFRIGRQNFHALKAPFFFMMMIVMFPLAFGPDPSLMYKMAGGILMMSILLACLLPLNNFFDSDYEDKTLEQILISHVPLGFYVFLKILAHWLTAAAPLVLLSPIAALTLGSTQPFAVLFAVLPASMLFVLIGVMGAALTVGTRRGGMLLALLVLPLYIPALIFACAAAQPELWPLRAEAGMMFLYAGLAAALPVVPVICSSVLKLIME